MKLSTHCFRRIVWLVMLLCVCGAAPLRADGPGSKLSRGLAGLTFGFLELPGNMAEVSKEDGVALGLSAGFLKGVAMMVNRYVVSLYELLSFPFDAPQGYKSVMSPEYPWGYFTGADTKAPPPGGNAETPIVPVTPETEKSHK